MDKKKENGAPVNYMQYLQVKKLIQYINDVYFVT